MHHLVATFALLAWLMPPGAAAQPVLVDDEAAISRLLDLVAQRLGLMPQVAAVKWLSGAPIADPVREQAVLDREAAAAQRLGLAPLPVREFFALQIRLARELQLQLHGDWRRAGCAPCASPTDLAALRAEIDRIDLALLHALYVARPATAREDFVERHRALATARLGSAVALPADRDRLLSTLHGLGTSQGPGLARVQSSGILRIGTTGDYEPFSLEREGRLAGADVELALALAARLGVEPVFVRTSWATLVPDLAADRYDLALGGVSITPERERVGVFSRPYLTGGKTIVARCAERERYDTLREVDRRPVRVVVNPGGTNERYVREHLRRAEIVVHPDNRTVFEEILDGHADAMITDDVEAELQAHRHPELCRTYPGTLTRAGKAIFMPRDAALQAAVDAWLRDAIDAGLPARFLEQAMNRRAP